MDIDRRDIDHIKAHVTGRDLAWVFAHPEAVFSAEEQTRIDNLIARRKKHEPLAYLLGNQPFYGRSFIVSPAVLIPRPESELMIEDLKKIYATNDQFTLVDVGTGSGALAVTAVLEWPQASVIATDISTDALVVAKNNTQQLSAAHIDFKQGDLLAPIIKSHEIADVIFANLPYLPAEEIAQSPTSAELAYEPQTALLAGDQGLALIKTCIKQAVDVLKPGGLMYLEMLPEQIPLLSLWIGLNRFPFTASIIQDLSGQNRILRLTKV